MFADQQNLTETRKKGDELRQLESGTDFVIQSFLNSMRSLATPPSTLYVFSYSHHLPSYARVFLAGIDAIVSACMTSGPRWQPHLYGQLIRVTAATTKKKYAWTPEGKHSIT